MADSVRELVPQPTQSRSATALASVHSTDPVWQGLLATAGLITNTNGSMSSAALEGFTTEFYAQGQQHLNGDRLMATLQDLSTEDHFTQLQGGLAGGMVAGFVSPVTDLLGLGVLAEQLPMIAATLARRAWRGSGDLITEAETLGRDFAAFKAQARTTLRQILQDPAQLAAIVAKIGPEATKAAHDAGREAAKAIIGLFEGAPEKKQKPPSSLGDALTRVQDGDLSGGLSLITSRATNVREYIFRAPWAQTGYSIGHTVGAVVSNLLLLVFSDGVGNALAKIGAWVGELAPLLARGAEGLAALGRGIAAMETLIGQIISKGVSAIKPLEALLGPLFRLLQRFQGFARRLFGVAEHGVEMAAVKGAATVADEALAKGTGNAATSAQGKVVPFKRTVPPQRSPLSEAQEAALGKVPKGSREISRIGPNPVGPHPEAGAAAQPAEHALEDAVAKPVQLNATGTGDPFGNTVASGPKGPKQPIKYAAGSKPKPTLSVARPPTVPKAAAATQTPRTQAPAFTPKQAGKRPGIKPGDVGSWDELTGLEHTYDELEKHHMPQAAAGYTKYGQGKSMAIPIDEHKLTRSYGTKGRALAKSEQGEHFRTRLARDLKDVRGIARQKYGQGSKYNRSLRRLIEEWERDYPGLIKKP